jgi:hypothetical protein
MLRPAVAAMARAGITANQVTVFAAAASVAVGIFLCQPERERWLPILPLFLFVRMTLNAADGMLAREFGQKSRLGAYLNELGDVVADAFLYLPFAYLPGFDPLWIGVVIVLADGLGDGRCCRGDDRREPPLRRSDGEERPGFRVRSSGIMDWAGLARGGRCAAELVFAADGGPAGDDDRQSGPPGVERNAGLVRMNSRHRAGRRNRLPHT